MCLLGEAKYRNHLGMCRDKIPALVPLRCIIICIIFATVPFAVEVVCSLASRLGFCILT